MRDDLPREIPFMLQVALFDRRSQDQPGPMGTFVACVHTMNMRQRDKVFVNRAFGIGMNSN